MLGPSSIGRRILIALGATGGLFACLMGYATHSLMRNAGVHHDNAVFYGFPLQSRDSIIVRYALDKRVGVWFHEHTTHEDGWLRIDLGGIPGTGTRTLAEPRREVHLDRKSVV